MIFFDEMASMASYGDLLQFVSNMQGDENVEPAAREAAKRCEKLFNEFYESYNRLENMLMLAYLAMDISANVSELVMRAQIAGMDADNADVE